MATFKITNVSNLATGSRGHFLDLGSTHGGKHIAVGGHIMMEAGSYDLLPEFIHSWATSGLVRVVDTKDGGQQVAGLGADVTPSSINPIREMHSDDGMDEEPDLSEAHEAMLPTIEGAAPINQSNAQTAKVSDAMSEERHSLDMSPIPGDKPVELGDASKFTVKAPRSNHPGSVVKSK